MKPMLWAALWSLLLVPGAGAQTDNRFAYPVDDAKRAFSTGLYEFVGIELADAVELPGLSAQQGDVVRKEYRIRSLNRRWQTFDNVEDTPERLLKLRQYGARYNLMLWRLLQDKKREELTRYRY